MNNTFPNLTDFILDELKNGIVLKYVDIIFGKYFIYALTPNNILHACVIYPYILSHSDYKNGKRPVIHFCNCNVLWEIYNKDSTHIKAKIPYKNSFDYKVKANNSDVKLFYDLSLPFCSECIKIYEQVFIKFIDNGDMGFWNLLWSNKSVLKTEQIAIEDNLMLNKDFLPMNVGVSKEHNFTLSYLAEDN